MQGFTVHEHCMTMTQFPFFISQNSDDLCAFASSIDMSAPYLVVCQTAEGYNVSLLLLLKKSLPVSWGPSKVP